MMDCARGLTPSRRAALRTGLAAAACWASDRLGFTQSVPPGLEEPSKLLIQKLGSSLLGNDFAPLISDPLLDLFGLGEKGFDFESYFNALEKQLDKVQAQLDQISTQLAGIEAGLHELSMQVEAIAGQITDLAIQSKLDAFSRQNTRVDGYFQQYCDSLSGLSSENLGDRRSAARDLFNVFSSAREIRTDLVNMQDLFCPNLPGSTGLLEYQLQRIEEKITTFASEPANFSIQAPAPDPHEYFVSVSLSNFTAVPFPNKEGIFGYGALPKRAHGIAREFLQSITAGLVRAFVSAQFKGMLLLASAWRRTYNSGQLATHTKRTQDICNRIGAFGRDAEKRVDACVARNLRIYGKRIGPPLKDNANNCWSGEYDPWMWPKDPEKPVSLACFEPSNLGVSGDCIMWGKITGKESSHQVGPAVRLGGSRDPFPIRPSRTMERLMLVERPWNYENCRVVALQCVQTTTRAGLLVSSTYVGQMDVPRFDVGAIPELTFAQKLA